MTKKGISAILAAILSLAPVLFFSDAALSYERMSRQQAIKARQKEAVSDGPIKVIGEITKTEWALQISGEYEEASGKTYPGSTHSFDPSIANQVLSKCKIGKKCEIVGFESGLGDLCLSIRGTCISFWKLLSVRTLR